MKPQSNKDCGFTLLELMTVFVVIAILVAMLLPAFDHLKSRAERAACMNNLKSLYVSADAYLQSQGHWPQIPANLIQGDSKEYARLWHEALQPYGLSPKNWICPSVQRTTKNPDYLKPENLRVDYIATPFDDNPIIPRKYPTHPWFAERGDVHGDGNLVVFTNGQIKSLSEIVRDSGGLHPAP